MAGGPVQIDGDGTPYRSYLYAADLAIWLWTLLIRGERGTAYNVGSSDEVTIRDLAHRVVEVAAPGAEIRIARQPVPGAPAERYVPATERAAGLGLRPWISLGGRHSPDLRMARAPAPAMGRTPETQAFR